MACTCCLFTRTAFLLFYSLLIAQDEDSCLLFNKFEIIFCIILQLAAYKGISLVVISRNVIAAPSMCKRSNITFLFLI